jgi:ATP-binding cassette, subfamily C, bacterial CydD
VRARRAQLTQPADELVATSINGARKWFVGAAAAGVATTLSWVLVLLAVASLISAHFGHHSGGLLWFELGAVGVGARLLCGYVRARLSARGANVVESGLRHRLIERALSRGAAPVSSAVASRLLVEESRRVAEASARWEPLRIEVGVVPAVLVSIGFSINWLVGLLLLVAAPLIPLNMAMFGMGAQTLSTRQANQTGELNQLVLDRIKGADTLRALGAASRERYRVREAADELARRTMSVLRVALLSSAALEALVTYAVAMVATYIGLVLLRYVHIGWAPTSLDLRSGLFLLLLAPAFFGPFRDLAAAYHDRQDVTAVAETLSVEFATEAVGAKEETLPPIRNTLAPRPLIVRADAVGMRYPAADVFAVSEVDWRVPRGALAGVAGPSGAGKTTMLRMLSGRLTPTSGALEVGAEGIAWVSQRPYFFQASIAQNLSIARQDATDGELWDALRRVGLAEVVAAIPQGLDTQLGWSGDALSGGQARRLALARALLCRAEMLVLDEPTAHLDGETEESLIETIVALVPRHTVIVASHSLAVLERCDLVLHLNAERSAELADVE